MLDFDMFIEETAYHIIAHGDMKTKDQTKPGVLYEADTIINDGSALVNSLPPRTSKTFEDYAMMVVLPTIQAYSTKYHGPCV